MQNIVLERYSWKNRTKKKRSTACPFCVILFINLKSIKSLLLFTARFSSCYFASKTTRTHISLLDFFRIGLEHAPKKNNIFISLRNKLQKIWGWERKKELKLVITYYTNNHLFIFFFFNKYCQHDSTEPLTKYEKKIRRKRKLP